MTQMFRTILLAADQYRWGGELLHNAILLAKKLRASLRMICMVDFRDLEVYAAGAPDGAPGKWLFRHTPREARLAVKAHEILQDFAVACEAKSVSHSSDVLVGPSEAVWAEQARSCDILMILPIEEDFPRFERLFGSMFCRVANRSGRPVLIVRREELIVDKMVLFYSHCVESARALPWISALCSALGMGLSIYADKAPHRDYASHDECQTFLAHHDIPASLETGVPLEVLKKEADTPGSQLDAPSLLVFDGGFHNRPWFQKRRRLVERILRTSERPILLCP